MKLNKKTFILLFLVTLSIWIIPKTELLAATATIQSLSPGATITIGNQVTFSIISSGFNSAVSYSISDSASGSTVSSSNINGNNTFSWIPTSSDVGTHNITVTITDQSGASTSVNTQITVPVPASVTIQNVTPSSSVNVGQTIFWNTYAVGFTNPTYTLSDSNTSSSLFPTSINSSGGFSWTPKEQDVGSHTVTVYVSDSSGHSATAIQGLTVGAMATATITSLSPFGTITPRQPVTFNVTATGFTIPVFTVSDSIWGSSIGNNNINSSGNFSWTPNQNDVGIHTLTIRVTDPNGNSAKVNQDIVVSNAQIKISSITPGLVNNVSQPFTLYASTTGLTSPTFAIQDSFSGTTLSTKNINSSGILSWTPIKTDVGAHYIGIHAGDSAGNTADTAITLTVYPNTITDPLIVAPKIATTTPKYKFTKALSLGSRNSEVTELQKYLLNLGLYTGPITGYFGPITRDSVKKFQIKNKLSPIGSVGPATRTELNK
jgi:C4-type Zn-finger protein